MRGVGQLSELEPGGRACVLEIQGDMGRRLQDLGLIKGTEVICLQRSPLGDPAAFRIRGAVIALRCEDSSCVRVCCYDR